MTRGGSFRNQADRARVANRNRNAPGNENRNQGFRVLLPGRPEPADGQMDSGPEQARPRRWASPTRSRHPFR